MIFKVSNTRKVIEALIISAIITFIINNFSSSLWSYISGVMFLIIFSMVVVANILNKDIYVIEKGILTVPENGTNLNILIKDILFIEEKVHIGAGGRSTGDGVRVEHLILTKELEYKIEERFKNESKQSLTYVLEHLYHIKVKK